MSARPEAGREEWGVGFADGSKVVCASREAAERIRESGLFGPVTIWPCASVACPRPAAGRELLQIGDRVRIVGRDPPWSGETGRGVVETRPVRVVGTAPVPGSLAVALDGGEPCGVQPHQVRRINDG